MPAPPPAEAVHDNDAPRLPAQLPAQLPAEVEAVLQYGEPVLGIDFGSMGQLGLLKGPMSRLLLLLAESLRLGGMRGVMLAGGCDFT